MWEDRELEKLQQIPVKVYRELSLDFSVLGINTNMLFIFQNLSVATSI